MMRIRGTSFYGHAVLAMMIVVLSVAGGATAQPATEKTFEEDVIETKTGDLKITCIGHGTLMLAYQDKIIHVDPVSREADYAKLPKADLVLITHEHGDHLDTKALGLIRTAQTQIVVTPTVAETVSGGLVMKNGDVRTVGGFKVEAVPAYNLVHKRDNGQPFHPKGRGNGYIVTLGQTRVYIAGDTENTPEMKQLEKVDIAFLPMNLPYTMTPAMVADAAQTFKPKILYPYHYGRTDPNELVELLKDNEDIEVRVRQLQ